jgi:predicted aldo/keto reductase-like oxidoreductase
LKYRKFGSLEWTASLVGFDAAGLPLMQEAPVRPDPAASVALIRYAIDCGVNYIDLGYPYDLKRQELIAGIVADALLDGYSEKVRISVTLPSHLIRAIDDFDFYLDRQLGWLRASQADFCLLGQLNRENWPLLLNHGVLTWADAALKSRKINNVGFSFHDHFQVFKSILAAHDRWSLCQFQFSFMDVDHDPGISGIKYAARKGLAVVVAEPLKSRRLMAPPPPSVAGIWEEQGGSERLSEYGLRFVWNFPEIATAVLAPGSIREIAAAMSLADQAEPDSLTIPEEILVSRTRDEYLKLKRIPCLSCRPCLPCPEGIDVPRVFEIYNDAFIYADIETARSLYRRELHQADVCTRCRICEDRCAKKLPIIDWLDHARRLLG